MFWERIHSTRLRLKSLIDRRRLDRDLEDEIAFHLAMREQKYRQSEMTDSGGSREARLRFGNPSLWKEISRDMWTFVSVENLVKDLRYGARVLLKNRGFTVVAVITLALGIGATTAIFSVVDGILLNTTPFKDPGRLVSITEMEPFLPDAPVSPPDFCDWKAQSTVFERIGVVSDRGFILTGGGPPERLVGAQVSTDYFQMLGIEPVLGRDFSAEEDDPSHQDTVLISSELWKSRFGGAPDVVGKALTLSGSSYKVIGVMPAGLKLDYPSPQVWEPVSCKTKMLTQNRGTHFISVVGRLKTGTSIKQAQSEMDTIASGLSNQYPASNDGIGVHVTPLAEAETTDVRSGLLLLLAAVGFVLLIVCANVANLQLVRMSARQREMAVRAAVGASRTRLVHQLLTEGLLLALAGGALGLAVAYGLVPLLARNLPRNVTGVWDVRVNGEVMLFTLALAVATAVLFGIFPALRLSRPNLNDALASSQRQTAGAAHRRLRSSLVVSEMALALLLLVSAGLMFRSFILLRRDNPGFDPRGALTMRVALPAYKYKEPQQAAFFKQALDKISTMPGVVAAGAVSTLPGENGSSSGIHVAGQPEPADGQRPLVGTYTATPEYFHAAAIQLLGGRVFTESDDAKSPLVTVIDKRLAEQYFPGENPIGRRVNFWGKDFEIVGVVGNVKEHGFNENMAEAYASEAQLPGSSMSLVVRTAVDPLSLTNSVTGAVQSVDSDQPVWDVSALETVYDEGQLHARLNTSLFMAFGLLALILSAVGIYGVMSYSAAQRTHEIGIRMAMGARPAEVMRLMLGQGASLALLGVGIGVVASIGLTRLMSTLLFGVKATDPITFAAASIVLILVGLAACYVPARRATSIDPMRALRDQ